MIRYISNTFYTVVFIDTSKTICWRSTLFTSSHIIQTTLSFFLNISLLQYLPLRVYSTQVHHSFERKRRFLKPWFEFLREEEVAYGWPLRQPPNLISQPSMFLGTHESNRNCPRTLLAFMLVGWSGRKDDLSLCSSCEDDGSVLLLWYGAELGKKKWSLGPVATLFRLWLESTATFWRSHINSEISSCVRALSPSCRSFSK